MTRNPRFRTSTLALRRSSVIFLLSLLILLTILGGCGGKSKSSSSGYTFQVSAGTLNNGTSQKGLVVLTTLRDSAGNGPGGAAGWQVTITGPGINTPLVADYDDGSPSSYITWWSENIEPQPGTYTASASNGSFTLTRSFTIDVNSSLIPTALSKSGDVISWPSITNAGSYFYQITDAYGTIADSGYLSSSLTSFVTPSLPDGDYQVEVFAHTKNRLDLMTDPAPAPSLPAQENMSLSTLSLPVTGYGSGYYLKTSGGVLYMGNDASVNSGADQYGFAVWMSLQTSTGGAPPDADWTVTLTGPGISGGPLTFTYPASYTHYHYWDFGYVPGSGLYTVSATNGSITLTDSFTIPNTTAQLPVAAGLAVTSAPGGYSVYWNPVQGASSYYVNLWTCVGAGSQNTPTGCTNGGMYTEIAGGWVNTASAFMQNSILTNGLVYDVYVTASAMDMTTTNATPPPTPTQANMSDTTFTYVTFTAH